MNRGPLFQLACLQQVWALEAELSFVSLDLVQTATSLNSQLKEVPLEMQDWKRPYRIIQHNPLF